MAQKSDACYLGLEFLNPNKSVDMAQLLTTFHDKYVPATEVNDTKEVLHKVPLDGDQLTEERARNVQWTYRLGATSFDRLDGLETNHADWYWKVKLFEIAEEMFIKAESSGDIGTSIASMNRTGKITAKKGPYDQYNAFKEFFDRETEAHIITAWLAFVGLDKMDGVPCKRKIPESAKKWTEVQKRTWLHEEIAAFLDLFLFAENTQTISELHEGMSYMEHGRLYGYTCRVDGCNEVFMLHPMRVKHECSQHSFISPDLLTNDERDNEGYYKCRDVNCFLLYKTKASRNRHERKTHDNIPEQSSSVSGEPQEQVVEDYKYNYHVARLFYGLLMVNTHDSIREGDAARLMDCMKMSLLFFKKFKKHKYAYTVLLFLCKVFAILSEREAFHLCWNRFFNGKGGKGKNIPLDLKMEFYNHMLKSCLRMLGGNINAKSAQRVARCLTMMQKVLDSVDCDVRLVNKSGAHKLVEAQQAVSQIVNDLVEGNVFSFQRGREGYTAFPNFERDILKGLDYRDFFSWSRDLIKTWYAMYE